jgi:HNH endonuclease
MSTQPTIGRMTTKQRFWSKVNLPDENGCLIWNAGVDNYGYGQFRIGERNRKAHQVALEFAGIEIPLGLEPDHTCEVRACVNVDHMEIVTHAENVRRSAERSTHCQSGRHQWNEPGVTAFMGGERYCRPCRLERRRFNYAQGAGRAS